MCSYKKAKTCMLPLLILQLFDSSYFNVCFNTQYDNFVVVLPVYSKIVQITEVRLATMMQ